MTERQAQILDYIREHIDKCGFPPTIREIGEQHGIRSTNTVNYHLNNLARAGHIIRHPDVSRGLELPGVAAVRIGDEIEAMDLDGRPIGRVLFAAAVPKAA